MSETRKYYKGVMIELDMDAMRFKRDSDNQWMKLPPPKYLALTQRRMSQRGGIRASFVRHTYNAFCVYIKAGSLNILAYQGRRDRVIEEAERLVAFLDVEIKDLIPRDKEGRVIDDDADSRLLNTLPGLIFMVVTLLLALILVSIKR